MIAGVDAGVNDDALLAAQAALNEAAAVLPPSTKAEERSEERRYKYDAATMDGLVIVECAHCQGLFDFEKEAFECLECGAAVCQQWSDQ